MKLASLAGYAAALLATWCAGLAAAAPATPEAPVTAAALPQARPAATARPGRPTPRAPGPATGLTARQINTLTTVYTGPLQPHWVVLSRRPQPAAVPAQEPARDGMQLTSDLQPAR